MKKFCAILIAGFLFPLCLFGMQQPKQELPKGEITPSYGPLSQNQADIGFTAEFLLWYATLGNFPYADESKFIDANTPVDPNRILETPSKRKSFDPSWDPGFRIGVDVVTNHNGWDISADWTYFYNSTDKSTSVPNFDRSAIQGGQSTLHPYWFPYTIGNYFNQIKSKWSLNFNQIDLVLGRRFWISPMLTLHPFCGLRGHWSSIHLRSEAIIDGTLNEDGFFSNDRSRLKQKLWSVGLTTGIDTTWFFTKYWGLYGEAQFSLTYGTFNNKETITGLQGTIGENFDDLTYTFKPDDFTMLLPTIDLALGLRCEFSISDKEYHFRLDLGWENHSWISFNQLSRPLGISVDSPIQGQYYHTHINTQSNLSMSGLVARMRFSF